MQGCKYMTKTWAAYKQHCRRKHGKMVSQIGRENESADEEMPCDENNMVEKPECFDVQKMVAKFLINLEAAHKVSVTAVDHVSVLTEKLVSQVKNAWLKKVMGVEGVQEFKADILKAVNDGSLGGELTDLQTRQRRQTYYGRNFKLVSPQKVLLGCRYTLAGRKGIRPKPVKQFGYCVPLQELLQKLLCLPEIIKYVTKNHESKSERMEDICDGEYLKSHPLRNSKDIFLQFVISYDDLELQNPLRANKMHKLAMFYFTLLNIPPQFRSQLQNIFLLAISRTCDLRQNGLGQLLGNFLQTVQKLRHEGIEMFVGEEKRLVRGDLIFAVCDTPAAALLGGFKESTKALKSCRMCNAGASEMQRVFVPSRFKLRDRKTYEDQCKVLSDPDLRKKRSHWSKMYGVNKKSVLCRLESFPVTENLVQDPMHCLLEGVCGQEIALFLNRIVYILGLVSLDWVNNKLQNFPYARLDARNRPNRIEKKHITMPAMFIKQKASVILTLSYILPLILGEVCEMDPFYRNFLACMKITCVAFSPYVDKTTAAELEQLIVSYCMHFADLYPEISFKPKMHYILHLPRQMLLFGPLRLQNTFRFEGKHGWFKDYRWKNFVNLPRSLSEKHQLLLANAMTDEDGKPSDSFVYKGDYVRDAENVTAAKLEASVIAAMPDSLKGEDSFYITSEVIADNLQYSSGDGILLEEDELSPPAFCLISDILCTMDGRKFLVMRNLRTVDFEAVFNAYSVVMQREVIIVREICRLDFKWPLPVYSSCGKLLITNRYTSFSPSF